ncbi:hypothetical protein PH562_11030 [Rhizobium sp. CNPSo 4062]|uniref:hypothetical protein n=1 Tax=Rhizobium sp. CNPSo 4062 TaxID=3021410 RepID=UPI00254C6E87|nr:hypothetical protein [Rhizobium sp. CNPSo 4062]MDK4702774.1 hypothetical protein [Rhizobium sp. CNPSo 4062]
MRMMLSLGAILSLACVSAGEAPSNYQTYHGGIRADSDPVVLARYDRALNHCEPEAYSWRRGSPDANSTLYWLALRNCLYRQGFVDRGVYAYPTTAVLRHILDR